MAAPMPGRWIKSTEWLAGELGKPDVAVVDGSYYLPTQNRDARAEYTAAHGLRFRPHTKTHKIPALARRQLELGAAGLTVAKVGEAEVMLATGVRSV